MLQVVARRPQDVQGGGGGGGWKPPFWRQAAPLFEVTVRFLQPHCPALVNFSFACTETQYVPSPSDTAGLIGIEKLGAFANTRFGRDWSSVPGRLPAPFE
jgi:hypothetical protein